MIMPESRLATGLWFRGQTSWNSPVAEAPRSREAALGCRRSISRPGLAELRDCFPV